MKDNRADQPVIMGVVNVTPDSFSDGGKFHDPLDAIMHGMQLMEEGADILDIGGESTRPNAQPVSVEDEQARILPVIEGLAGRGAKVSVDTRHAETMRKAIDVGANMINDVMALCDEGAVDVIAQAKVPVCLMHMQGNPQTMQNNPNYGDVVEDVYGFLESRVSACINTGIEKSNIIVDPGIGFGKSLDHNLSILKSIKRFNDLTGKTLLGTSRKSFIAKVDKGASEDQRIGGSLASILYGYSQGVRMFRVHDVKETRQAFQIWNAIEGVNRNEDHMTDKSPDSFLKTATTL